MREREGARSEWKKISDRKKRGRDSDNMRKDKRKRLVVWSF